MPDFQQIWQKAHQKKSDTNFVFKMRQIGRLGSGIVEMGAVKRLIVQYGVYNQSKTEKNDGISDKKRLLKPMYNAT